ncbi:FixH family protein [Sinorhizobium sp. PC2]|uniref:FixH family protein n=1 Tax=Ensifer aridi TaxID=1708715 RepID=UPI000614D47A
MISQGSEPRRFTGWHMVAVMALFFGTIISINFVMAWSASRSWSGLVVENAYVASQQFNGKLAETRAFAASGIKGELTAENGLRYVLTRRGKPEREVDQVVAVLKRPVEAREDVRVELVRDGEGVFISTQALKPGQWIADVTSKAGGVLVYRQAIRFIAAGEGQ